MQIFSQQIEKSEGLGVAAGSDMNRSTSSTSISSSGGSSDFRRQRFNNEERSLVKNPKEPPDSKEPLNLKNLTEAVWSFVTIPVSGIVSRLIFCCCPTEGFKRS